MQSQDAFPSAGEHAKYGNIKVSLMDDEHPYQAFQKVRNALRTEGLNEEELSSFEVEADWIVTGIQTSRGLVVPQSLDAPLPEGQTVRSYLKKWVTLTAS